MRISDWSSDVCSSDLVVAVGDGVGGDDVAVGFRVRGFADNRDHGVEIGGVHALGRLAEGDVALARRLAEAGEQAVAVREIGVRVAGDRKSKSLNSSHYSAARITSSAFKYKHNTIIQHKQQ